MKLVTFFTLILLFNPSVIKAGGCIDDSPGDEWRNFRIFYIQGCRQNGMAGAGYSFPNDENLLLLNPAGLGIDNKRFRNKCIMSKY